MIGSFSVSSFDYPPPPREKNKNNSTYLFQDVGQNNFFSSFSFNRAKFYATAHLN